MTLKYIVEICVALDIAIFGIAYPIIINEIGKIGDEYKSSYLSEVFNLEVPQKNFNRFYFKGSRIKFYLLITICSFLLLILNLEPWWGMDFWLINNSAYIIVLILTIVLTTNFILWLDKLALYNGKTLKILKHIILKFDNSSNDSNLQKYCLKTINEFAFYAIRNQDSHIQKELLDFYSDLFVNERKHWAELSRINNDDSDDLKKQKTTIRENGVEYRSELYDLVYTINLELSNTKNLYLKALEHRVASGWWLYGSEFEQVTISNATFQVIWRILSFSVDNDNIIKQYWSKAHQYFKMGLDPVLAEYSEQAFNITNQDEINFRDKERKKFFEFHFALGGLLLYKERYESLKYILSFSQSTPPRYVLLPQSMTDIFYWYEEFRNEFKYRFERVEISYSFPDLDNYGVSHQIKYWISQYIIILFVRQFSLQEFFTFQDHTGKPTLPDDVIELRNWLDSVTYFQKNLKDIIDNSKLIEFLGYEALIMDNKLDIELYLHNLKEMIRNQIVFVEETKDLSLDKIGAFKTNTEKIINEALNIYRPVLKPYDRGIIYDRTKLTIQGTRTLMTKSAFVENETPHFNFDSVLAGSIKDQNIKRYIPNAFIYGRTHRFLFSSDLVVDAIKTLLNKLNNPIIIGFNIGYRFIDSLKQSFKDIILLPSSQYQFENVIYVLEENDLPVLYKKSPSKDLIGKYFLEPTSVGSYIHSSILDLSDETNQHVRNEWLTAQNEENINLKVQVMIWMLWLILWKKNRKVIQISIDTKNQERGVRNSISDLEEV